MKPKYALNLVLAFFTAILILSFISVPNSTNTPSANNITTVQQIKLDGNNISSYIWNTGVIDQDNNIQNTPGFEWIKGTGKFALFTAGLSLGGYVNNQLRLASASYKGEYSPGYCLNGTFQTNANFRLYKVKRGDNPSTPDWANWGLMVPYGAPYIDANLNGIYEPAIDTPGIRGAVQTIFICFTDADPLTHTNSEGFSGGTTPMGAEVHLTAWCYDNAGYQDMQFLKWVVINKSTSAWDSTIASIVSDPDLGFSEDDYLGCDTAKNLGYCYNSTNNDAGNSYAYGLNPPAVGMMFLINPNSNLKMKSFGFFINTSSPGGICERDPATPVEAYWLMKGYKNDGTPYVIPNTNPPVISKYNFPGDPESGTGWTEYTGKINNCGGSLTGPLESPTLSGDRRFIMSYGSIERMNPGDTQVVFICQLVARGTNNKNSVNLLKQLATVSQNLCQGGFVIGATAVSTQIPNSFELYQNYPNPFNPVTKIKFDIPNVGKRHASDVRLTIYDALGREILTLVNEQLIPGTYEAQWDASNYPSGVYFYRLNAGDYSMTNKMILLK